MGKSVVKTKILIFSLVTVASGLWYSSYKTNTVIEFTQDEKVYYNHVEIKKEFSKQMYEEDMVNINTASKEEFLELEGIDEERADKIIEYRTLKGGFLCKSDLMAVEGISEKIYNKIADRITVVI